jgi:hypothetical protein
VLQAKDLLEHASRLLIPKSKEVDWRRAVSASYYAVFHLLTGAVASQVSPVIPAGLQGRTRRVLEHRAMKTAMKPFLSKGSFHQYSNALYVPCAFSDDLRELSEAFGELQDARHLADYDVADLQGTVDLSWATDSVDKARRVFAAWDRAKSSEAATLFLAAMIFDAKWAK